MIKRLFFLLICAPLPLLVKSQEAMKGEFIKGFTTGVMLTSAATHNFGDKDPFTTGWTFAPSMNVFTAKTHDHIMYDCGSNSIETLNGWLLPKNWDIYTFLSKSLATKDFYSSIGIEKLLPVTESFKFIFFIGLGTNFTGTQSITIGLVAHPQLSLKKKRQING